VPEAWLQGGVDWGGAFAHFAPDYASPLRAARRIGPRLLLVHGDGDTQVTPRHSLALAEVAGRQARRIEIRGADHASVVNNPTVLREGLTWLALRL
jgi:pimeloyl-ACP methyl ester carboxylesterase